jgi:hypothetical protein
MSSNALLSGRKLTVLFLAVAAVATTGALVIGINDNPVGIMALYVASASLILAWAHRFRRAKQFVILLVASVVGFPVAVVAHNLLYGLGEWAKEATVVVGIAEFFHVLFFFAAILICPAGVVIGAVGSLVVWGAQRRMRRA